MSETSTAQQVNSTTNGATPGVKFPDQRACPFVLIEVPVGTKVGDEVIASNYAGKAYGPYRVSHLADPGDNAVLTFAMAWKVPKERAAKSSAGRTSKTDDIMAQMLAMQQAQAAEAAEIRKQNAELLKLLATRK